MDGDLERREEGKSECERSETSQFGPKKAKVALHSPTSFGRVAVVFPLRKGNGDLDSGRILGLMCVKERDDKQNNKKVTSSERRTGEHRCG